MPSLDAAQRALAAGSWAEADSAFRAAIEEDDDPAAHEGLAQVSWWRDDAETCLEARETAYRRHRERHDPVGAARAATALAWDSLLFGSGKAVAVGWLGRAHELLSQEDERAEHGWVQVREAELALSVHHDPVRALSCAAQGVAIGRRTHDDDLEVAATALQGLALIRSGDIGTGMAQLDACAAAATAGDVADLMWAGKVLCWLIAACHEVQDVTRAEDWCRRVEDLCLRRDLAPLLNVCRIQYASVQISGGRWDAAEEALTSTHDRLAASRRSSRLEAVVVLGELRRRQGRLAEAETLFAQAEFDPVAAVGRALVWLAQGQPASAWAAVQAVLHELPSSNPLARADALLPAVRIAHAVGDHAAAAAAAAELRRTATAVGTDALLAMAALADSLLAEPDEACALLREAVRRFHRASLRHDEAESRMRLAASLAEVGDTRGSAEQVAAASAVLAGIPDLAGLEQAETFARSLAGRGPHLLTLRESEVLGLVAQGMSTLEIASELGISSHTVHRHVANVLTKLDQPTRAGAVAKALVDGLI